MRDAHCPLLRAWAEHTSHIQAAVWSCEYCKGEPDLGSTWGSPGCDHWKLPRSLCIKITMFLEHTSKWKKQPFTMKANVVLWSWGHGRKWGCMGPCSTQHSTPNRDPRGYRDEDGGELKWTSQLRSQGGLGGPAQKTDQSHAKLERSFFSEQINHTAWEKNEDLYIWNVLGLWKDCPLTTLGIHMVPTALIKAVGASARGGPAEPASPSPATVTRHSQYDYLQVRVVTDGFILKAYRITIVSQ